MDRKIDRQIVSSLARQNRQSCLLNRNQRKSPKSTHLAPAASLQQPRGVVPPCLEVCEVLASEALRNPGHQTSEFPITSEFPSELPTHRSQPPPEADTELLHRKDRSLEQLGMAPAFMRAIRNREHLPEPQWAGSSSHCLNEHDNPSPCSGTERADTDNPVYGTEIKQNQRRLCRGWPDGIRKEAWSFCRTISGVRLCWELEEPQGPQARGQALLACVRERERGRDGDIYEES